MTIKKLTMMLAAFLPIWGMLWRYKRRKRAVIASPVLPVSLLNVVFDAVIALAYFSIPIEVAYFYHRHPTPQLFWVYVLFFSFIMLCGITHAIHALSPYELPAIHATFKVLCGLVSIITAVYLVKFIPAALKLPNYAAYLEYEIQERQLSETTLRNKNEESQKLRECTEKIRQTLQVQSIFSEASSSLCAQLELSSCTCIRYNATTNRLYLVAPHTAHSNAHIRAMPHSLRSANANAIATFQDLLHGEHIRLLDLPSLECLFGAEALIPYTQHVASLQVSKATVCTHLSLPDDETALLILSRPPDGPVWSVSEIELVRDVANQVEIALAQARSIERDKEILHEMQRKNRELEQAQQKAESATQAKSKFIAIMSHEMRTPLYVVTALTELLMDTTLSGDQRESLATIQTSSQLLLSIISDVLDYSKFQQENFVMDKAPFNIRACIEKCIDLTYVKSRETGLNIYYYLREGFPEVVDTDDFRLSQVFLNLLSNAVKFTSQGAIHIEGFLDRYLTNEEIAQLYNSTPYARAEGTSNNKLNNINTTPVATTLRNMPPPGTKMALLHFMVTDTGVGIAHDQIPRLFQEFTQLDTSISRKYEGSGLGLAICRKVVTLMGGSVWVDSTPGVGSTFHFTVVAKIPPIRISQPLLYPTNGMRGLNVLIISPSLLLHRQCADFGLGMGLAMTFVRDVPSAQQAMAKTASPYIGIFLDVAAISKENAAQAFRQLNSEIVTFVLGDFTPLGLSVPPRQILSLPLKYKSFYIVMRTLAGNPPDDTFQERYLSDILQAKARETAREEKEAAALASYVQQMTRSSSGTSVSSTSSPEGSLTSSSGSHPSPRNRDFPPFALVPSISLPHVPNDSIIASPRSVSYSSAHPAPIPHEIQVITEPLVANHTRNVKVLLVEDNAVCRKVCLKQLTKLGFNHVDIAVNGQEALDRVSEMSYDVVMMDVMMPGVDGLTATRSIRQMGEQAAIPRDQQPYIIAITASSMLEEGSREACFNAGMDDVVNKPIHLRALNDALIRYFTLRHPTALLPSAASSSSTS